MKKLTILFLLLSLGLSAQVDKTIEFDSKVLSEMRSITIHLPKSYQTSGKKYPVIYALDGEYTRLALTGTTDYYSFWDKIPECIVVSIDQNYMDTIEKKYQRWIDCSYSWTTGFPKESGVDFKSFISDELIPFVDSSYRTTRFRTIVGHSFTANYVNYFLTDKEPLFTGYVAISPYYATNGLDSLKTIIDKLNTPIFYYVASGELDLSGHKTSVNEFDKLFSKIENENFIYGKFEMKDNQATHYTIFPIALPSAIEHLFSAYGAISEAEFQKLLKEEDKVGYLKQRYIQIERVYGISLPIREDDLNFVGYGISKKKQWDQLKQIAELTKEIYPESFLGYWTMGEYFEKTNDLAAALEQYEKGLSKLGEDVLNISDFQKEIDRVKSKMK